MKFDVYQGTDGQWYWRCTAKNGKNTADGSEGYASKRNARRALDQHILNILRGDFTITVDGQPVA